NSAAATASSCVPARVHCMSSGRASIFRTVLRVLMRLVFASDVPVVVGPGDRAQSIRAAHRGSRFWPFIQALGRGAMTRVPARVAARLRRVARQRRAHGGDHSKNPSGIKWDGRLAVSITSLPAAEPCYPILSQGVG